MKLIKRLPWKAEAWEKLADSSFPRRGKGNYRPVHKGCVMLATINHRSPIKNVAIMRERYYAESRNLTIAKVMTAFNKEWDNPTDYPEEVR